MKHNKIRPGEQDSSIGEREREREREIHDLIWSNLIPLLQAAKRP